LNNKIVSIKRNSAIFLAIVLVTGTIALYSSSFMTTASAQSEFYYDTDEYTKYAMDMVNDYEDSSSHENNDAYDSEYQSYENDNYKSKDKDRESNSISISKVNCNNVNIIGDVTGDISVGNNGRGVGETGEDSIVRELIGNAVGNNGERYYNGYQKDKDFTCIINNNNTIITADGDDNATATGSCEDCFNEILSPEQLNNLITFIINEDVEGIENLEDYCTLIFLTSQIAGGVDYTNFIRGLGELGIPLETANKLVECLINIGTVFIQA
jgi:hypothetical protein